MTLLLLCAVIAGVLDGPPLPPGFTVSAFSGLDGFFSGAWQTYIKNGATEKPAEIKP